MTPILQRTLWTKENYFVEIEIITVIKVEDKFSTLITKKLTTNAK